MVTERVDYDPDLRNVREQPDLPWLLNRWSEDIVPLKQPVNIQKARELHVPGPSLRVRSIW